MDWRPPFDCWAPLIGIDEGTVGRLAPLHLAQVQQLCDAAAPLLDFVAHAYSDRSMSMIEDLDQIVRTVLPNDPSFRGIERADMDRHIEEALQNALAGATDDFLLSLMRLLALPGNGHTRLIPNAAISICPLRFVAIGTAVRLLDAAPRFAGEVGGELISVNDVPVAEIADAAKGFLAGTSQRARVIGPILLAWPAALRRLGVWSDGNRIEYRLRNTVGRIGTLVPEVRDRVPGSVFYPRNEHGKAEASWTPQSYLEVRDFGKSGLLLVLPSFFDPGETSLSRAVSAAAEVARSRPDSPLLIDLRGNTGGDFLLTLPLIEAIAAGAEDRKVAVLVDKFTFSAAIVFVAILKHRLKARLTLVGDEMGDGLTFYAEGGTVDLSFSGAVVRYSTAFHDWAGGRIDETTPAEIAERIVAAGTLELNRIWSAPSDDALARDLLCREVFESLVT
jgi:hypothetical protein